MSSPTLVTIPASLLLALTTWTAPAPARECQPVEGQIDARANHFGLDLHGFKLTGDGTMQGSLSGNVTVEIRKKGSRGPLTDVSVKMRAITEAGPVTIEGVVAAQREHPSDPFHVVRGSLALQGRDAASSGGALQVEGTADTKERLISIRYSGEICSSVLVASAAVRP